MFVYIALLRGINVGGKHPVKMQALQELCDKLGFTDVSTYLQSGNVVFKSTQANALTVTTLLQKALKDHFQFTIPVILLKHKDLLSIYSKNPFLQEKDMTDSTLHVTILERIPSPAQLSLLPSEQAEDRLAFFGSWIYLHCPNGYGHTKFNNNAIEKNLGVVATTRNWNTIKALLDLAGKIA